MSALVTRSVVASSFLLPLLASATSYAQSAPPIDRARCVSAYDGGQALRADRKLRAARAELLTCGSASCPAAMQRECLTWLGELDAELPSIVVHAHLPDGTDVVDVRVLVDGEETQRRLDGGAVLLDPGPHRLRFERNGSEPTTRELVAQSGEKLRAIDVVLTPSSAPVPPPAQASSASPRDDTPTVWPGYVLGGVSVVGLASFTYFGLTGVIRYQHLKNDCSPACSTDDSHDVKQKFRIADISLGVSALTFVGAAYFLWWRPAPATSGVEVGLLPTRGGGLLSVDIAR